MFYQQTYTPIEHGLENLPFISLWHLALPWRDFRTRPRRWRRWWRERLGNPSWPTQGAVAKGLDQVGFMVHHRSKPNGAIMVLGRPTVQRNNNAAIDILLLRYGSRWDAHLQRAMKGRPKTWFFIGASPFRLVKINQNSMGRWKHIKNYLRHTLW